MIVAGFGFRASAPQQSLHEVYDRAVGTREVDRLALPQDKAYSAAFRAFAASTGVGIQGVQPDDLKAQQTRTQSAVSYAQRGTGSVAEAAALAAAGPNARLLTPRIVSSDGQATCALAEGDRA